ncbi:MAG TPA: hypothetical protein VN661_09765 [Candidatus Acidoferrales bacterium]|nr:hypothetical protein [Candidatus Acidoferrales bacterium]
MLAMVIWTVGTLLEGLLLFRALHGRFFARYPYFFAYIAATFLSSGLMMVWYLTHMLSVTSYHRWYWTTDLITLLLGYGVLLEIFRHVLARYPGAERVANTAGLTAAGLVLGFAWLYKYAGTGASFGGTMIGFERDLRFVQATFVIGIILIVSSYGLALGRNMKGMVTGYGLYVATSLVTLAVRSYAGASFEAIWNTMQPLSYLVSLLIWVGALWSFVPAPLPKMPADIDADYERVVLRTRGLMRSLRSHLIRTARP